MTVVAVFMLLLAGQTSASFFGGFQSAFVSVENSFGKLLNDVVSDVKVTIDCTVVAVQNALSLGGMFGDHSEYERRCRGENANKQPTVVPKSVFVTPTVVYDIATVPPVDSGKQSVKREIKPSIINVGNTIKSIIDKPKPLNGLETVKTTLINDVTILDNVGSSLTKQLDDITSDAKKEVEHIGAGSASTVNEVLDKINILHKVTDQQSDLENSQISHAFSEVMDAIRANSTVVDFANDKTAKAIMKDLEQTSTNTFTDIKTTYSQFRNEENKHLDDLKDIVESKTKDLLKTKPKESLNGVLKSYDLKDIVQSKVKDLLISKPKDSVHDVSKLYDLKDIVESKTKPKESVSEAPKSFKTLAQQIMDGKPGIVQTTEKNAVESVTEAPVSSTVKSTEDKSEPTEDPQVLLFNAYFASNSQDADDTNEAMSLIERSRYSQMLMNSVFTSDGSVSVFDNPELLKYR